MHTDQRNESPLRGAVGVGVPELGKRPSGELRFSVGFTKSRSRSTKFRSNVKQAPVGMAGQIAASTVASPPSVDSVRKVGLKGRGGAISGGDGTSSARHEHPAQENHGFDVFHHANFAL